MPLLSRAITLGEGWGLPTMEAMAMGLPVIVTNWGGSTEFITPQVRTRTLVLPPVCTVKGNETFLLLFYVIRF